MGVSSVLRAARRSVIRRLTASSLLLILGLAVWAMFLRPVALGGTTGYLIVSGNSMEPAMYTGDLAVLRQRSDYGPGDVVAYRIPRGDVGEGLLVIHRITAGDGSSGFTLRGDNREHPDMWRPRTADVVGALQLRVPRVGTALFLLRSPLVLAAVAGFLGFWVVAMREPDAVRDARDPEGGAPPFTATISFTAALADGIRTGLHVAARDLRSGV